MNFMGTSHSLQHGIVGYYRGVSSKFDEALYSVCRKNSTLQETTNEINASCIKACDQDAFKFFTGTLENTKKKQKILFNECSTLCNVTARTIHMMGLTTDDSGCSGKPILNVHDSSSIKEITEKVKKNIKPASGATHQ